jgi:hypothetical protein
LKAQGYSVNLIPLLLAVAMAFPATQVSATTQFTPLLGLNHTFINVDSLDGSDAGGVSVISPGFDYSLESRHTTLNMSLLVDAEYFTGLDRDNRVLPYLDSAASLRNSSDSTCHAGLDPGHRIGTPHRAASIIIGVQG